jgi:hypothetical protein
MKKHVLVVLSNPVRGREDDYNEWYSHQHIQDVLRVPGFLSAQRFTIAQDDANARWRYLAIYEFEAALAADVLPELFSRAGTAQMVLSEAMDLQHYSATPWVAITDRLIASG